MSIDRVGFGDGAARRFAGWPDWSAISRDGAMKTGAISWRVGLWLGSMAVMGTAQLARLPRPSRPGVSLYVRLVITPLGSQTLLQRYL